ncbi:hypothetical protein Tco_0473935 [Tanacetum coccineum]
MEVKPLDHTKLEDLSLNTCNQDIPLSSREIMSFDEPEPQPQTFPSFPSLEVDLGEERGLEPPIKPPSPDSFRMKEVDHLTNHTPPSPHVASFHPKDKINSIITTCVDDLINIIDLNRGQFLKELCDNTFSGSENEDANEHIERVLEIFDLFTTPDVTQDQLMLHVFPISLTRAASRWLRNEPAGSITTQEILKGNFLSKYCPPSRTAKRMEEINNFQQGSDETLYQAWERTKKLLLRCPQHYLTNMQEVVLFYKVLDVPTRQILDSKGGVPKMEADDAKKAIQEMADYSQKCHYGTSSRNKNSNTSDGLVAIQAQLNNLDREIKKVNERLYAAQVGCELCGGPHYTKDCPLKKEAKTVEDAYYTQFGVPFLNPGMYRAAALGFYQRDNGNPSYHERRQTMEESLSKFMVKYAKRHDEHSSLIKEIKASTDATIRNQGASIKALDIQIGQMSKVLQERGSGSLPSSTEINPRNHVKSISTVEEADIPSIHKIEFKGKNVVGASINVLILVGKFSVVTDFAVVENMDAYRDKDMGDVIFGKPFCRVAVFKARRFDGFITIGDGNDSVTYQMALSHLRFKHLSNDQCNKIRPLLQVSARENLA